MRGITRLKRIIRSIKRTQQPVTAILIYHRVINIEKDPYHIAVSEKNFSNHVEYICEKYTPLSLAGYADLARTQQLPHRSVVITFDDGYRDNFVNAKPILENANCPATIFAVSGKVNGQTEFWWDDVERVLLSNETLPENLQLSIGDKTFSFDTSSRDLCQAAFAQIHPLVRLLSAKEREQVVLDLANWSGLGQLGRPDNLPMKEDELRAVAQSGLIEIGAHTITHPVLSTLTREAQQTEIMGSQESLEKILGNPVRTFSYPYGNPSDFNSTTLEIVKAAGFVAAVTTVQGSVEIQDDIFQLKRCEVNNWPVDEFRRKLDSFFYI
jgi:peptidoglycan/xylan/chitin deacetylase (PgdA/CDA1 family)